MNRWWRLYALLGVATVVLLLLAPIKSFFREWRHYQMTFNRMTAQLPQRVPPVKIEVKQLWIQKADRVDRCVSCHLGFDNPNLTKLPQPYRTHPQMAHDPREFGCTICHQGQGLGTDYVSSIGLVPHWDQPILPKRYLEASCGRCHKESDVPQSPILNEGRRLLQTYSCAACHEIPGIQRNFVAPLDGIGVRMERVQLYRWLREPSAVKPGTHMPNFQLSPESAADLTDYLLTFTRLADGTSLGSAPQELSAAINDEQRVKEGGKQFREARCISCHLVNGQGGKIAEELGTTGSRLTAAWLWRYLDNPRQLLPGVPMPHYGFGDDQRMDLIAYISSELRDWDFDPASYPVPALRSGFFERGQALWTTYHCVGCHKLNGAPAEGNMGPSLKEIGVKPTYSLDLGKRTDVAKESPAYLQAKLTEPHSFFDNLRMPRFELKEDQVAALVTALLANGGESELPSDWLVGSQKPTNFKLQGPAGRIFERYSCLTCHSLEGQGGTMAPELTAIGSQLNLDWIRSYLNLPFSRRPILTERMPNLLMSRAETDTLLDFIRLSLVSDDLDSTHVVLQGSEQANRGRALFYEKFACSACHQVKSQGGYVGPPLDGAGQRLKAGWIKKWLLHPQHWRPGTLEPKLQASDAEVSALAAFVLSL
jgi:cytochrome c2